MTLMIHTTETYEVAPATKTDQLSAFTTLSSTCTTTQWRLVRMLPTGSYLSHDSIRHFTYSLTLGSHNAP